MLPTENPVEANFSSQWTQQKERKFISMLQREKKRFTGKRKNKMEKYPNSGWFSEVQCFYGDNI